MENPAEFVRSAIMEKLGIIKKTDTERYIELEEIIKKNIEKYLTNYNFENKDNAINKTLQDEVEKALKEMIEE